MPCQCQYSMCWNESTRIEEMEGNKIRRNDVIDLTTWKWTWPIKFFRARMGLTRFGVHYRMLDAMISKDAYPILQMDGYFDWLVMRRDNIVHASRQYRVLTNVDWWWQQRDRKCFRLSMTCTDFRKCRSAWILHVARSNEWWRLYCQQLDGTWPSWICTT